MENSNYLPKGYRLKDYEIEGVLGAGGFGITYLARDIHLKTEVVIKEFLPQEFSTRDVGRHWVLPYTDTKENSTYAYLLKKFLKEAQILASIKHPNVVRVFSFFEENNTAYFVMDYISGESLKSYIERKKTINESEILSIILPLLEGLKEVHRNNYLHRDIAPDNIYLRENGMSMLIDFGAAKNATRNESSSLASIVKSGYSAPEQYSSNSKQTNATDIYAMGSVLYSMISGKVAPESTVRQMAILNDESDPLEDVRKNSSYRKKYSKELLETIYKAMQIRGKDRFQDVQSIQSSIYAGVKHEAPKSKHMITNKKSWDKKIIYILSSVVVFIGLLGVAGVMMDDEESKDVEKTTQSRPIKFLNESKINKEQTVHIKTLKEKCKLGDGKSCSLLAKEYYDTNDRTASLMFAKKACDLNDGKGCGYYSVLIFLGIGVPIQENKALTTSNKACDLDNAEGCILHALMHNLERGGAKRHKKENELYKKGRILSEKSCGENDAESCANLGFIYLGGLGVTIDKRKSFSFYKKACNLGDSNSCTSLGLMTKNKIEAKDFYEKGCSLGDGEGCTSFATLIKDSTQAVTLWKKACNTMYNGKACYILGQYYNMEKKPKKSKLYYQKAYDLRYKEE